MREFAFFDPLYSTFMFFRPLVLSLACYVVDRIETQGVKLFGIRDSNTKKKTSAYLDKTTILPQLFSPFTHHLNGKHVI